LYNHFLKDHYLRFVCAVWYWHFVDIVWILLFLTLYCWGSW
jgi:cytochrome c oxidase subunit 3